jgi:hypothetical protein
MKILIFLGKNENEAIFVKKRNASSDDTFSHGFIIFLLTCIQLDHSAHSKTTTNNHHDRHVYRQLLYSSCVGCELMLQRS